MLIVCKENCNIDLKNTFEYVCLRLLWAKFSLFFKFSFSYLTKIEGGFLDVNLECYI